MILASLVIAAIFQAGAGAHGTPVMTIEKGHESAIDASRQATARTQAEWVKLWKSHSWDRKVPKVDFTKDMVVGVFLGSRPTAGYDVEIVATRQQGDVLVVEYRETKPARDAMTAQILTAPYHLVAVPKSARDVKFEKVETEKDF